MCYGPWHLCWKHWEGHFTRWICILRECMYISFVHRPHPKNPQLSLDENSAALQRVYTVCVKRNLVRHQEWDFIMLANTSYLRRQYSMHKQVCTQFAMVSSQCPKQARNLHSSLMRDAMKMQSFKASKKATKYTPSQPEARWWDATAEYSATTSIKKKSIAVKWQVAKAVNDCFLKKNKNASWLSLHRWIHNYD